MGKANAWQFFRSILSCARKVIECNGFSKKQIPGWRRRGRGSRRDIGDPGTIAGDACAAPTFEGVTAMAGRAMHARMAPTGDPKARGSDAGLAVRVMPLPDQR